MRRQRLSFLPTKRVDLLMPTQAVHFKAGDYPELRRCPFCSGRFKTVHEIGIGYLNEQKDTLCCSEVCANLYAGTEAKKL